MSINIYWSCLEKEWMRATPPTPIFKNFYGSDNFDHFSGISKCPAFHKYNKNIYSLNSIYSYDFKITKNEIGEDIVKSDLFDQQFMNDHLIVRSLKQKMFSFLMHFIFFTEEKSLNITMLPPYLEKSDLSSSLIFLPGEFDMAKWYRPLEFPFILRGNSFSIKEYEPYVYIKFNTKKKIKLVQFYESEKLAKYREDYIYAKEYNKKIKKLEDYYQMSKLKDRIIKEIKNNVIS